MAQPDHRIRSSITMNHRSSPPSSLNGQALDHDSEEDDLDSLDVPDLPQTTLHFPNASQQPVNLIGHPLPGNFVVADALAPFPQPAPQDEGCCRSKYQHRASLGACLERFKDSKYWDKEHADDIVFSDIPADDMTVPVDEILSIIRQRRTHPESGNEPNRDSRSQSRTVSMNQESHEIGTTLDRMERVLAETKAKLQAKLDKGRTVNQVHASLPPLVKLEQAALRSQEVKEEYQTPPHSATFERPVKSEQDAEDVLAALGVSGAPKPVTADTWPDQHTGHDSPCNTHKSRSRSSSAADVWVHFPFTARWPVTLLTYIQSWCRPAPRTVRTGSSSPRAPSQWFKFPQAALGPSSATAYVFQTAIVSRWRESQPSIWRIRLRSFHWL